MLQLNQPIGGVIAVADDQASDQEPNTLLSAQGLNRCDHIQTEAPFPVLYCVGDRVRRRTQHQ